MIRVPHLAVVLPEPCRGRRWAPLDVLEEGDVAIVHVTGEVFLVTEPLDPERLERFEISPTSPIFGTPARIRYSGRSVLGSRRVSHTRRSQITSDSMR